ncbi:aspartic peptidase domain-containing protein [Trichoderma evansii]
MHFLLLMALAASAPTLRQVAALSLQLTKREKPAVLSIPVDYHAVSAEFITEATTPLVNVTVGTPPQAVRVAVDLQDSITSVLVPDIPKYDPTFSAKGYNCSDDDYCTLMGYFDPDKSSTFKSIPDPGSMSNPSTDVVSVGGQRVDSVPMSLFNIYPGAYSTLGMAHHPSFPFILVDQGFINSPSFSLWSDTSTDNKGHLLLGGINKAMYEGPLQAFPFPVPNSTVSLPIASVVVENSGNSTTGPATSRHDLANSPAILSTLDSHTFLPSNTVQQIYADLGITPTFVQSFNGSIPFIDCARQQLENHTISLLFGNVTISAPWSALVQSLGNNTCELSIYPYNPDRPFGPGSQIQIGAIFLRHMYLAVDYENMFAAVAPLNLNPGLDDIIEIGNGPRIPDADGKFPATITTYGVYTPTPTTEVLTTTTSSVAVSFKTRAMDLTLGVAEAMFAFFYLII